MSKSVAFLFTAIGALVPENKQMDINERVDNYRPVRRTGGRAAAAVLGLLFIALSMLLPAGRAAAENVPPEIVGTGDYHTCGLKPDGSVQCWGWNSHGQAESQTGPFTQISVGDFHTCGLKPDGSVQCWGYNVDGQAESQTGPFTQVSARNSHTCGLRPDGSVQCWGSDDDGQAEGQTGPFTQVSTGYAHTCGLKPDGSVQCWGLNSNGQATNQTGPYTQVTTGGWHTCGLEPDGSVECWGANHFGQAASQTGPFAQVSAGNWQTCGLKPDGSVECWGDNEYGEGDSQTGPFTQVSAGAYHSCGLKPDGSVECWGDNDDGQAASQTGPFGPYVPSSGITIVKQVDGGATSWSFDFTGDLGAFSLSDAADTHVADGLDPDTYTITETAAEGYSTSVSCDSGESGTSSVDVVFSEGENVTCTFTNTALGGITVVNQVVGGDTPWSFDFTGDLGAFSLSDTSDNYWVNDLDADTYTITQTFAPGYSTSVSCNSGESGTSSVDVVFSEGENVTCTFTNIALGGITTVKQFGAGFWHTCGLKPDGSVLCWGDNASGQATNQTGPFMQISVGGFHNCGLKPDGDIQCWGNNAYGQSGWKFGPFTQVSAGDFHTCGLRPDGSVLCWGLNGNGQATSPTGPFTQISVGSYHTCGLKPNGSVQCWGLNDEFQATSQTGPFIQVSAGGHHTCGHKPDGSVECWGDNDDGQAESQTGPFTQISAGADYTCGVEPDGSVECWGLNEYGEAESQTGPFMQVSAGSVHTCGLKPDGSVECWGYNDDDGQADSQSGPFGPYEPPTTITVSKRVVPNDIAYWSFAFTGDLGAFSLSNEDYESYVQTFTDLDADTYTITETAVAGYSTEVSCDSGESGTNSIDVVLGEGESVYCEFTNTVQSGITVVKEVVGGGTSWSFDFTGDLGAFSLTDAADSHVADDLDPDTYTISETAVAGYSTEVNCDSGDSGTNSVDVVYSEGENITCTFTNTFVTAPQIIYVTAAGGKADNDIEADVTYLKGDILKWDGTLWTKWFSGTAQGLSPKSGLAAFDVDDDSDGSVWLSWQGKLKNLPGVGLTLPQDIVYFDGTSFQPFFDGSNVGLTTAGEKIDGVQVLPGDAAQGFPVSCLYYLLVTTQAGGLVPNGSDPVIKFTGEDVLGFCMTSVGVTTAGLWQLAVDLGAEGLGQHNNIGLSASDDANTIYFLPKKAFTLDGATIKPSEIAVFDRTTGMFSGPLWKPKDHGLKKLANGIDILVAP